MIDIIIFSAHMFSSLFLFLCMPLPFLFYAARKEGGRFKEVLLKAYRVIFVFAHGALFVLIATGVPLIRDWTSGWTWFVVVVTLVMGASLGITAKAVRKLKEGADDEERQTLLLRQSSILLTSAIFVMFALKYGVYFF